MAKQFIVRKEQYQRDKVNKTVYTWEDALKLIGKTEQEIYLKVPWLNNIDHFFIGTPNYIRETTN